MLRRLMNVAMILAALWITRVDAAPGLAIVTRDASANGKLVKDAQPVQVYATPKAGDYVRVAPVESEIWTTGVWKPWPITATEKYEICTSEAAEETWANATCTSWDVAAADASTFSASVLSGLAPLSTVLSWDVKDVDTCLASGSWSGAKAAKGTQAITGLAASATYTLLCTRAASTTGSANLTWMAPTQNTDGSALTNLSGFKILYGPAATQLTQTIGVNDKAAAAYKVTGLAVNSTVHFAMRAVAGALESANTGTVSSLIKPDSSARTFTKTVGVVVTAAPPVPNPPTGLTVGNDTRAYRIDLERSNDLPRLFVVGTVPSGTACDKNHPALRLYRVDRMKVVLNQGVSRPSNAWAACG